jgi:hypothetical protein
MLGETVKLNRQVQEILASWIAMSAMCGEFLDGADSSAVLYEDRKWLRNSGTPSKSWKIWIGSYRRDRWLGYRVHHSISITEEEISEPNDKGLSFLNTQSTAFVAGQLYVLAFSSQFSDIVERMKTSKRAADRLCQVWPIVESEIAWPPVAMSDVDAERFADGLFNLFDEALARQNSARGLSDN